MHRRSLRSAIRRRLSGIARYSKRRLRIESLERRQLMAADTGLPLGATTTDTGEFLLGRIAVTPVLFESNGAIDTESQNWTPAEIQETLNKVSEGVHWWSDTLDQLNTVHELEFVIDDQWATTPFETSYEVIDRPSDQVDMAIQEFLTPLGYAESSSLQNAVHRFNNDQRQRLQTDFAFTIFIVDSSDDPDGSFASGGSFSTAFAYAGGLYVVTPSTRPASTIAHEMGHIFYARDEYPGGGSWTDERGYYNTQNWNASDNPTSGFVQENSIMRAGQPLRDAYDSNTSPVSTLAQVGWQDSDGDGVFDVLDVPLELELTGYYDVDTSVYHAMGHASAIPLMNRNSSGNQSDVTLNEIDRLEYRLDGGNWLTVASSGTQTANIDVEFSIPTSFNTIEFRVIDDATGITSEIVQGSMLEPATSDASIRGAIYLDEDASDSRQSGENLLAETTLTVRHANGTDLFGGTALAGDLPIGVIDSLTGVQLSSTGVAFGDEVAVFEIPALPGVTAFHGFDLQRARWTNEWDSRNALSAEFDQNVGQVTINLVGVEDDSYGRVEALDALGNLLARETSSRLDANDQASLTIQDPHGRIAEIRVYGHANSSIGVSGIDFQPGATVQTSADGTFQFENLADGQYQITATAKNLTHQFDTTDLNFEVVNGVATPVFVAATIGNGPRHNLSLAADVNQDDEVTALDALLIINDLNRSDPRLLGADEQDGFKIDVNNDGFVTAVDALLVINSLNRVNPPEGEFASAESATLPQGSNSSEQTESAGSEIPGGFDSLASNGFDQPNGSEADLVDQVLTLESDVSSAPSGSTIQVIQPTLGDLRPVEDAGDAPDLSDSSDSNDRMIQVRDNFFSDLAAQTGIRPSDR